MDVTKLLDKIMATIDRYEEERKKEGNEILFEFYGIKITELRIVVCEICDWAINEILKEGKNETEGSTK